MPPPRQHVFSAALLFALSAAIWLNPFNKSEFTGSAIKSAVKAEIGIENEMPLAVSIEASNMRGKGLIIFTVQSEGETIVSVPEEWKRKEVRNAALKDVKADPPEFGFIRWHLPPSASVTFEIPVFPSTAVLHKPSNVPAKVSLIRVDLAAGTAEKEVMLLQKESVRLW